MQVSFFIVKFMKLKGPGSSIEYMYIKKLYTVVRLSLTLV